MADRRTLPQKMREAADILEEADKRGNHKAWSAADLRVTAERWEYEDIKKNIAEIIGASIPVLTMDAKRAARIILDSYTVTPK